ncbi:colicin D domain-containing protein [Parvularcula sp. IMCC14364]|uniref:colicin D domain-containing protein n=1 Tax=Parvularcula sp. IMCC14364 TaxID=3067902 RepID=UPI0027412BAA|nr:colicin D domain-containing protein [Parvularcula sp. IMCC14364]
MPGRSITAELSTGDGVETRSGQVLILQEIEKTDRYEKTFNLTVADFHTFFVGEDYAKVHNTDPCNAIFATQKLQSKFKHAEDFGVFGNWSPANGAKFQDALVSHLNADTTIPWGVYRVNSAHKVFFNNATNNAVVLGPNNEFITGFNIVPNTKQWHNYIKNGNLH